LSERPGAASPSLKLTRAGKIFGIAIALVLVPAYLLAVNLMFLMAALFLAILAHNLIYAALSLRGAALALVDQPELYARTPASFAFLLRTPQRRLRPRQLRVTLEAAGARCESVEMPQSADSGETMVEVLVEPERRGWVNLRRCRLRTDFPFGLACAYVDSPLDRRLLAYPQLLEETPSRLSAESLARGLAPRGGSDYQYLGSYRPGDDVRMIHWRKSTLLETPVLRRDLTSVDIVEPRMFVPDSCPHFEYAISALARLFAEGPFPQGWTILTSQGEKRLTTRAEALEALALAQPLALSAATVEDAFGDAVYASEIKPD